MRGGRNSELILHPAFVRGREALAVALKEPIVGQIIFVVGLSGVGKSEIRYWAMRESSKPVHEWRQGQIPAIAVRATPSDRSNFNPKEFIARMYSQVVEPNLDWLKDRSTIDNPDSSYIRNEQRLLSPLWRDAYAKGTEHQMRGFFERTARARGLEKIFVEEGASLTYTPGNKQPDAHMVNLMCLAEEISVTLVFFGVPRMALLWERNAEVLRRSRFVYVQRYRLNKTDDRENFGRLAISVSGRYRFAKSNLVHRNLDLAYVCSAGVFGELEAYYRQADDIRATDGAPAITKDHLEKAVSSETVLKTLHDDAAMFDLLSKPADARTIRKMLGS